MKQPTDVRLQLCPAHPTGGGHDLENAMVEDEVVTRCIWCLRTWTELDAELRSRYPQQRRSES